ncbi:MAG: nuclear transport factor 2 family protein [Mycobacterium sp.]
MGRSDGYFVLRELYDAYDRGDQEAFFRDLSPDLTWVESVGFPAPGVSHNRAEIQANLFDVLERDWTVFRFTLDVLIDGGEFIVGVGTYRGTHRVTKKNFEARASHVWHVRDKLIDSFEQFADTEVIQRAAAEDPDDLRVSS